jgi:hypothetical protein
MPKYPLTSARSVPRKSAGHYLGAVLALLLCALAALTSARAGASRLFSEYGSAADSLTGAERAIAFSPADPEAHYAYALRLADSDRAAEAVVEFERAATLRPRDYFFWQELGRTREENGDANGAIGDLRRAVDLAPDYAQSHWQLGNVLLRTGETTAAFAEMRRATNSDPSLFPALADFAWGISEGDAHSVLINAQPRNGEERLTLARLFASHQQIEACLDLVATTARITTEDRLELVAQLLEMQEFHAAQRVWVGTVTNATNAGAELFDGGFEATMSADEKGFGWRTNKDLRTVQVMLDPNAPASGKRSLRLEYADNYDDGPAVVSQLVAVAPNANYRLRFAARTEDLVSAALPLVTITDARTHKLLAETVPLASGTNEWREFSIDFQTFAAGDAITISIARQSCTTKPCPIFGRAWFDNFELQSR